MYFFEQPKSKWMAILSSGCRSKCIITKLIDAMCRQAWLLLIYNLIFAMW